MNNGLFIFLLLVIANAGAWAQSNSDKIIFPIPSDNKTLMSWGNPTWSELDGNSINILSWNILKGEKDRFYVLFPRLISDKDLVLNQEAVKNQRIGQLFNTMSGWGFTYAQSFLYPLSSDSSGVMTISRAKPTTSGFIRSEAREPGSFTPKMILLTKFSLKGLYKQILVANVHGINFVINGDFRRQMKLLEEAVKGHNGPVLISGDFNTWNQERQQILGAMAQRLQMKFVTFQNDARTRFMGQVVDQMLIKDLSVRSSKVEVVGTASDHNALSVELSALASY